MAWKVRTTVCEQCGEQFSGRFGPNRQFCSVACRQVYRNAPERNPSTTPEARIKISKARKGKPTTLGIPCSPEKRAKISAALQGRTLSESHKVAISCGVRRAGCQPPRNPHLVGPNHPNWKGGYAKERQARYGEPEYKMFVHSVLGRDNYTCQYCGARNGLGENVILQVHHKKPFSDYPELAYDVDNGLVLCVHCHRKAHKGMPRPVDPNYHGKPRICQICGVEFRIKNGRKYCPDCREAFCCPVCGSTKCHHKARELLQQTELFEF